jgi:MFS family permease
MDYKQKPGIFYGWVIVAAGFVVLMTVWGFQYAYGIFFESLCGEFNWTRGMVSGAYSVYLILHCALYPLVGVVNDRYGPRKSLLLCVILMSSGFALMSQINAPWQLYLVYGVVVGSGISFTFLPVTSTVTRWFVKRRGTALGIAVAGIGIGTMALAPLAQFLISQFGWRTSYLIIAVLLLIIVLPVSRLMRLNPSEKGLLPYGVEEVGGGSDNSLTGTRDFTVREAVREKVFWILFMIGAFHIMAVQTIMLHLKTCATDVGIPSMVAATILGVVGGASVLGRIAIGSISDRIGRKQAYSIALLLMAIMMLWLLKARQPWEFYLFSAIFGFGYGGCVPLPAAIIGDWFGTKSHGGILGVLSLGGVLAGIGPWMAGHIFDVTGSYDSAFIVAAAMLFAAAGCCLLLKAPSIKPG